MDIIKQIRGRVTILLIEHDMKVVMGISDRVVVLDYGVNIAEGLPQNAEGSGGNRGLPGKGRL